MPGVTLNWDKAQWRWNVTGNADLERDATETDRDSVIFRATALGKRRTSGISRRRRTGPCSRVPAGNAGPHFESERARRSRSTQRRAGTHFANSLGRTTGNAAVNLDVPISRRGRDFSALGNLTLNANAEIDQLSDFGTLTKSARAPTGRRSTGSTSSPAGPAKRAPRRSTSSATRCSTPPDVADLRLHDRPDGTGRRTHRRQSEPAGRPRNGVSSAAIGSLLQDRPSPPRRLCAPDDRSADL